MATIAVIITTSTSCNVTGWMDSPSGDAQNLSKAEACLNSGDFACATKHYQLLSSTYGDVSYSEQAFSVLSNEGISMGDFLAAVVGAGNGGIGKALTGLATTLSDLTPGETKRKSIYQAYRYHLSITEPTLRALVKLVSSLALAAEILSEEAGGNALTQSDLVNNPSSCSNSADVCPSACIKTGTKLAADGAAVDLDADGVTLAGGATLQMLQAAVGAIGDGANSLGTGKTLGSDSVAGNSNEFAQAFGSSLAGTEGGTCYRKLLLSQGIGE